MSILKIGIISETLVQQHSLKRAVEDSGYQPLLCVLVEDLMDRSGGGQLAHIEAWIVDVDVERLCERSNSHYFEDWLANINKPVIFGEGNSHQVAEPDVLAWTRQLRIKLLSLEGQLQLQSRNQVKAKNIWVLAASTGGPEMVKRFLDKMDKDLNLGFIYVQHIDQKQYHVLSETICRDSHYEGVVAYHGEVIANNTLAVVPADSQVELQKNGTIILHKERPWRGVYSPSIDQIIANVAHVCGPNSGVIFFTGMGSDGSAGCRLMSLKGGHVWAQSLSSCTVESMPKAAIETGCVEKIDTVESLAIHLKLLLKPSVGLSSTYLQKTENNQ